MAMENTKSEVLDIFSSNSQGFVMASKILSKPQMNLLRSGGNENDRDGSMEVIWVGTGPDDGKVRVICQMSLKQGGIVNSYLAKAVTKDGSTIAKTAFVSFSENTAFAILELPCHLARECRIDMEIAAIGSSVRTSGQSVSLDQFDFEETMNVQYTINAPKRKEGSSRDQISISYYTGSSLDFYDYIYPGQREQQLYFPTEGEIVIREVLIDHVDMTLKIDGGYGFVEHPKAPRLLVEDDTIGYKFEEKWGKALQECFGNNRQNADVKYLLKIAAQKTDGHILTLLVTNINLLSGLQQKPESVKVIEKINAYVDCFAEGTKIMMADGTQKAVELLRAGDLVRSKGQNAKVKEVELCQECQVETIILENGLELSLTGSHGVHTDRGLYPLSMLSVGDQLFTTEGMVKILRIVPHCDHLYPVYQVFLEDSGAWMYAGKIAVHDSDSESAFAGRDWVREGLPKEWLNDYDYAVDAGIVYGG